MKAQQRIEQPTTENWPENSCKSTGRAFKGNANYKKAKSAKKTFCCFVCWPTLRSNYLLTGISTDSTTVRHDRTKSTRASMMIKATLKGNVFNTWLKGMLVTSWP